MIGELIRMKAFNWYNGYSSLQLQLSLSIYSSLHSPSCLQEDRPCAFWGKFWPQVNAGVAYNYSGFILFTAYVFSKELEHQSQFLFEKSVKSQFKMITWEELIT